MKNAHLAFSQASWIPWGKYLFILVSIGYPVCWGIWPIIRQETARNHRKLTKYQSLLWKCYNDRTHYISSQSSGQFIPKCANLTYFWCKLGLYTGTLQAASFWSHLLLDINAWLGMNTLLNDNCTGAPRLISLITCAINNRTNHCYNQVMLSDFRHSLIKEYRIFV